MELEMQALFHQLCLVQLKACHAAPDMHGEAHCALHKCDRGSPRVGRRHWHNKGAQEEEAGGGKESCGGGLLGKEGRACQNTGAEVEAQHHHCLEQQANTAAPVQGRFCFGRHSELESAQQSID